MAWKNTQTDRNATLSSPFGAPESLLDATFIIQLSKMVFLKLFIVLVCFRSFFSHSDVGVFEDNEDVNDGENVKIGITMMLTKHVLL